MNPQRWEHMNALYERASDLPAEVRAEFLARECGDDPTLVADIERYLAAEEGAGFPRLAYASSAVQVPGGLSGRELGDFVLMEELGRGGSGVVYLAKQRSLRRFVALKVLTAAKHDLRSLQRFEREIAAAAALEHPRIVPVHASDVTSDLAWYAMRYVPGWDLAAELDRQRERRTKDPQREIAWPPFEGADYIAHAAEKVAELAEAIAHAHEHGVIHRDVKPSNILLDAQGTPFLADFGLARDERFGTLTNTDAIQGTPYYMSPEQVEARRKSVDHRTDIYSLGVVLYEILSLRRPFEGRTSQEVFQQIASREAPALSRANPRVPRDLVVVVEKAMGKRAEWRYVTARDFADDLRRFLRHEAVVARRLFFARRILNRIDRRRRIVAACLIFTALAILAFVTAERQADISRRIRSAQFAQDALVRGLRDPSAGARLALESLDIQENVTARNALYDYLYRSFEVGRIDDVDSFVFDQPRGRMVAARGGAASFWEPRSQSKCPPFVSIGQEAVSGISFAQAGTLVAFSFLGVKSIALVDWPGVGRRELRVHQHDLNFLRAVGDGRRVVAGSSDEISVWDLTAESCDVRVHCPGGLFIDAVADVENGWIVARSFDGQLRAWRRGDAEMRVIPAASVSPSGQLEYLRAAGVIALWGGRNSSVRFLSCDSFDLRNVVGMMPSVTAFGVCSLGRFLAGSDGIELVVVDCVSARRNWKVSMPLRDPSVIAVADNGDSCAIAGSGGVINVSRRTVRGNLQLRGHAGSVRGMFFESHGDGLISLGQDRTARRWSLARSNQVRSVSPGELHLLHASIAPTQMRYIDADEFELEVLSGVGEHQWFRQILEQASNALRSGYSWSQAKADWPSSFSSDGAQVARVDDSGLTLLDSVGLVQWFRALHDADRITWARFIPGSHSLVVRRESGHWILNPDSGKWIEMSDSFESRVVVEFERSGAYCASISKSSSSIRVHRLRDGSLVALLVGEPGRSILTATFSYDGERVVGAYVDGGASVWDLSPSRLASREVNLNRQRIRHLCAGRPDWIASVDPESAVVWRASDGVELFRTPLPDFNLEYIAACWREGSLLTLMSDGGLLEWPLDKGDMAFARFRL